MIEIRRDFLGEKEVAKFEPILILTYFKNASKCLLITLLPQSSPFDNYNERVKLMKMETLF